MTSKKLAIIITISIVAVVLLATSVVFAGTRSAENVRATEPTETVSTETVSDDDTTTPETETNETRPESEETTAPTEETDDSTTSNTTGTTNTTNTTPNYTPTKNITGQADVVEDNSDVPVVTVVPKEEENAPYEDEEVSAVVIPTVVTPGTTFGVETTENTTATTDDTVRTDIVNPSAMDNNTVEEVVGVELEEVKEDEMPDFLP